MSEKTHEKHQVETERSTSTPASTPPSGGQTTETQRTTTESQIERATGGGPVSGQGDEGDGA